MYGAMTSERLDPAVTNLLVANAVDLVIHLGWVGPTRRITSVREITGVADSGQIASNELWCPGPDGFAVTGSPPQHATLDLLTTHGLDSDLLHRPPEWRR
jgi:hypothetical protein